LVVLRAAYWRRVRRRRGKEVIVLQREQIEVEVRLIALYEKMAPDIQSKPVRHLLHTIRLDLMNHIGIC
jgi:hypothetical protein